MSSFFPVFPDNSLCSDEVHGIIIHSLLVLQPIKYMMHCYSASGARTPITWPCPSSLISAFQLSVMSLCLSASFSLSHSLLPLHFKSSGTQVKTMATILVQLHTQVSGFLLLHSFNSCAATINSVSSWHLIICLLCAYSVVYYTVLLLFSVPWAVITLSNRELSTV